MTLFGGSYPGYMLNGDLRTFPYPYVSDSVAARAMASVPAAVAEIARRFAANPVGMTGWYLFGKPGFLWQWDNIDGVGDVFIYEVRTTPFATDAVFALDHRLMKAGHWVLVALALLATLAVWSPAAARLLPGGGVPVLRVGSLILAYTTLTLIPLSMVGRFAVPVYPMMYLMATAAVVMAMAALRQRKAAAVRPAPAVPAAAPPDSCRAKVRPHFVISPSGQGWQAQLHPNPTKD
jgi:hypothetical protein